MVYGPQMSVVSITPRGFPVPASEEERLAGLSGYGFLDGKPQDVLDQICRLAADIFNTPVALVSLIDRDEQVFAARCGLDTGRTPASCRSAPGPWPARTCWWSRTPPPTRASPPTRA